MSDTALPGHLPIIQAPMAGVQDSALTVAVSSVGGVGSLPCAMLSREMLAQELQTIKASGIATYNLNFFSHQPPQPDERQEARWRNALARYFMEYELDPTSIPDGPSRRPFCDEALELISPYQPPIVSFHFGLPKREHVEAIKSWKGQVWSSATTVDEALWLADHGVDAVIAQGIEAGGHRGMFLNRDLSTQLETLDLVAAIQNAVSVPVIASGGISTPEQVRAAMDVGAQAVQLGTTYLLCKEAKTSRIHRNLLRSPRSSNTQLTNLFSGGIARGIPNRLMEEMGPISDAPPVFPLAASALAPLRAVAEGRDKEDFSPLWCGTDATGCRAVSAAEQTLWLAQQLD
ncbi:nitronate monooxygenase [Congregibacter brevis]|uniref:Propionate 3-nitronate monooxygenase n=1 Tax=Congregibacter brevis TaxID=3081201 RepID=A0ABZ0IEE0_9GAMM|nr:nitronate monooxygenase [Congregibacter sp. IMCC45268]